MKSNSMELSINLMINFLNTEYLKFTNSFEDEDENEFDREKNKLLCRVYIDYLKFVVLLETNSGYKNVNEYANFIDSLLAYIEYENGGILLYDDISIEKMIAFNKSIIAPTLLIIGIEANAEKIDLLNLMKLSRYAFTSIVDNTYFNRLKKKIVEFRIENNIESPMKENNNNIITLFKR